MNTKKDEALKLALDLALDVRANANARLAAKAIALTGVIEAALAEQPAQHASDAITWTPDTGYVFKEEPATKAGELGAMKSEFWKQPAQQESEAVRAAWMAGYTEGERDAIEKAQQHEPVAWRSWNDHDGYGFWETKQEAEPWCAPYFFAEPLYISPPASKPWVWLTPEQRASIAEANNMLVDDDLFDEIEAKLREKNT